MSDLYQAVSQDVVGVILGTRVTARKPAGAAEKVAAKAIDVVEDSRGG